MKQIPIALALVLIAAPAEAKKKKVEEPPPPPEQVLIDDGLARLEAGDHEAAMTAFEQSAKISDTPDVQYHIALALYTMGRIDEAVEKLIILLSRPDLTSDIEVKIKALLFDIISSPYTSYKEALELEAEGKYLDAIDQLEAFIAIAPSVPGMGPMQAKAQTLLEKLRSEIIGTLLIKCNAAGGKVFVDGEFAGALDEGKLTLKLTAGEHHLEVSAPAHEAAARMLSISGGTTKKLTVVLDEHTIESCYGFDCGGHGICIPMPTGPMCKCKTGYEPSDLSVGCVIAPRRLKGYRIGAGVGLTLSVLGLVGLILTPMFAIGGEWEGMMVTAPLSFLFLSVGPPISMGVASKSTRTLGNGQLDGGTITGWVLMIASLTLSAASLPWAMMGFPPLAIIASIHGTLLAGIGIGMAIRTFVTTRKKKRESEGSSSAVIPFLSPVEGGAIAGFAGSF